MNMISKQRSVLQALTTEWQTPVQLANQLPNASEDLSDVQEALKDFLREGLVQMNPVVVGLYRLTADGQKIKDIELS